MVHPLKDLLFSLGMLGVAIVASLGVIIVVVATLTILGGLIGAVFGTVAGGTSLAYCAISRMC